MRMRLGIKDFFERAKDQHGDLYDYTKVQFVTSKQKVEIVCSKHGSFWQLAEAHWSGSGCVKCSYEYRKNLPRKNNLSSFLEKARKIHGDKYDYSLSVYEGVRSYLKIECPKHGEFRQMASNHLAGHGCRKCIKNKSISKAETAWLDYLGIEEAYRQYPVSVDLRTLHVDGFCPISKTVFEFYGDFWHGNPYTQSLSSINPLTKTSFGDLLNATLRREQTLLNLGYTVCYIWEEDFKTGSPPVYRRKIALPS